MNGMQARDHRQLWNGFKNGLFVVVVVVTSMLCDGFVGLDRFDQFWEVNKRLMTNSEPFRNIPYRIYQVHHKTS